jgi:hypothetical protein
MPKWSGYHVKTDGRAYFRLRVPKDLHSEFGPQWPIVNLGLKAGREAERLALMHYIAVQRVFAETRRELAEEALRPRPRPLSERNEEDMRGLAKQIAEGFNRVQHAAIRSGSSRSEIETLHEALAMISGEVLSAQGDDGLSPVAEAFLIAAGIPVDRQHPSFRSFVFEFAAAIDEHYTEPSARRLSGRHVAPPPLSDAPKSVPVVLTLGTVVTDYMASLPQNHYRRKIELCLKMFREKVGAAFPVGDLEQEHIQQFLLMVCRLPRDAGTRYQQKGETLAQLLAYDIEDEDVEVIAESTFRDNYRATLAKFLRQAYRDLKKRGFPDLSADYPYTGNRRGVQDKQRHLKAAELVRLFNGAEFQAIAQDPTQEASYWLPVISLYTGARPREICQVNPQCDWGKEGAVWYLDFNENKPAGKGVTKSIKTGDTRLVPLHPELVRLGLPAYLERMKASGADRLFPSFRVKGGNPYMAAGADFTGLLKATGLYDDVTKAEKVTGMYVFRKTFATNGDRQGVKVEPFIGHGESGKTMAQESYITSPTKNPEDMPYLYGAFKGLDFGVRVPLQSM